MTMKNKGLIGIIALAIMLSGCNTVHVEHQNGNKGKSVIDGEEQHEDRNGAGETTNGEAGDEQEHKNEQEQPAASSDDILIIIDQTEKPIEGSKNSFDFTVQKRPEGYMLTTMEWNSANHNVINSLEEAIQHGGDGEDGFYISGNGQFMGFFYDKAFSGETGTVSFTFENEQGDSLIWSKEITLH